MKWKHQSSTALLYHCTYFIFYTSKSLTEYLLLLWLAKPVVSLISFIVIVYVPSTFLIHCGVVLGQNKTKFHRGIQFNTLWMHLSCLVSASRSSPTGILKRCRHGFFLLNLQCFEECRDLFWWEEWVQPAGHSWVNYGLLFTDVLLQARDQCRAGRAHQLPQRGSSLLLSARSA